MLSSSTSSNETEPLQTWRHGSLASTVKDSLLRLPKRAIIYVMLNGFIVLLSCVAFGFKSVAMSKHESVTNASAFTFFVLGLSFALEKIGCTVYFSYFLKYVVKKKRFDPQDSSVAVFWEALRSMLFEHALLDAIEFVVSLRLLSYDNASSFQFTQLTPAFVLGEFLLYLPKSIIAEILFDFFHYWTHRICHMNKFLYKHVHYPHHTQTHPGVMSSFIMHPLDYLGTNVIPLWLTLLLTPKMSPFQLQLFLTYKIFIEVAGHSSVEGGLFSLIQFPIFAWYTNGVALYNQDHSWHHLKPNRNFCKRTAIWDHLFGTYEAAGSFEPRNSMEATKKFD